MSYFRNCCKQRLQLTLLYYKGAILVLIWSFLSISVYHYYVISATRNPIQQNSHLPLNSGEILAAGVFLPVGGWLADAYFGRYKVILCGMWTMWLGAMLNGASLVIGMVVKIYNDHGDPWVSFFSEMVMGAGFGAFQANIFQFGIDQLSDASSTEIISFLTWYTLTIFACGITIKFGGNCMQHHDNNIIVVLLVAVYITLALCSNSLFSHWLIKEQLITNPIPIIWKTVQYTVQNRCKWKTIFALGHRGVLSRLNIAKAMYGGQFISEQVEDVKTFFRVLAVIAIFLPIFSGIPIVLYTAGQLEPLFHDGSMIRACYKQLSFKYAHYILTALMILTYKIIIYPLCHKCIPKVSITNKFFISVLLFFAGVMILLGMESATYYKQLESNQTIIKCDFHSYQDIQSYLVIIPQTMTTLSCFQLFFVLVEFICAQAPFNMKGLLLGIGYALYGLGSLVQTAISIPFLYNQSAWDKAPLTCGIWYFIIQAVIVLVGFIAFIIMIKTYKRRIRIYVPQPMDTQIESVNQYTH